MSQINYYMFVFTPFLLHSAPLPFAISQQLLSIFSLKPDLDNNYSFSSILPHPIKTVLSSFILPSASKLNKTL